MRRVWPFVVAALCLALAAAVPASADHPRKRTAHKLHKLKLRTHGDPASAFRARRVRLRAVAAAADLPLTWCGGSETTVDTASPLSNAPQVKVVYAHPSGTASQFASRANAIQSDVSVIRERLDDDSGDTRTVRFDLGPVGPGCTASHADIETVALPKTAAQYEAGDTFALLRADLDTATTEQLGARVNYVAYIEDVDVSGVAGQADVPLDDSPGRLNSSNQGHVFAVIFNPFAMTAEERRATFLHEMSHNLGAVQDSAPNSSGASHCEDEEDIMCYDDEGPGTPSLVCDIAGAPADPFAELFDCGGNDYWNPAPADGSYLASHWNTFDSDFLCASAACDSAQSPPSVSLAASGKQLRGEVITFGASAPAGSIFDWDFDGDGVFEATTGESSQTATVYNSNGAVTPRVRATAANGTFGVAAVSLNIVEPTLPTPDYTFTPASPLVGQAVTLDASPTQDPDGIITRYSWDLDDDGALDVDNGLEKVLQTSFATAGPRNVWLQVDYALGFRAIAYSINVLAPPVAQPQVQTGVNATARVTVARIKLRALIAKGLPLTLECSSSCRLSAALTVDRKTAKKLRLKSRRIGSVTKAAQSGRTRAVLKLTRAAKRALRRQRRLAATLNITVSKAGPSLKLTRKLRF